MSLGRAWPDSPARKSSGNQKLGPQCLWWPLAEKAKDAEEPYRGHLRVLLVAAGGSTFPDGQGLPIASGGSPDPQ